MSRDIESRRESDLAMERRSGEDRASGPNTTLGVLYSNTPLLSSNEPHTSGGEDWFEMMFYVEWKSIWRRHKERLREKQENAKCDPPKETTIQIDGYGSLEVDAGGGRLGKGRKGPYLAFKLHGHDGLVVMLHEREEAHKTVPSMVARADGEYCLEFGSSHAYETAKKIITSLGGSIDRNKLSRVDMCLDVPKVAMREPIEAYSSARYITRAKCNSVYNSNGCSIGFGAGGIHCRIYDKKAETAVKANPKKQELMRVRRWGGEEPENAIRIEFQIRRDALKSRGIDTVEDYYEKRADLVTYLARDWLRLTEAVPDKKNKNQSKAKTTKLWKAVQMGFETWAGRRKGLPLDPLDKQRVNADQYYKQSVGVGVKGAEYEGHTINSTTDLRLYVFPRMEQVWEEKQHR